MKIVQTRDTLSEIYLDSIRIRNEVFIKEQGIPIEIEIDQLEALCVHFVLYDDQKKPLATCRIFPDQEQRILNLQRVAVLKASRGSGIGRKLILAVLAWGNQQNNFDQLVANVYQPAIGFYQSLDFVSVGEIFQEHGVNFLKMEKDI